MGTEPETSPAPSTSASASVYGHHCVLPMQDFANTASKMSEALKTEGSGILTEIDVQATMKAKLGIEGRPCRILGACHRPFRALSAEPDIGSMLPCNVVVRQEEDGQLVVAFMGPAVVLEMTPNPEVARVAHKVRERLNRVEAALVSAPRH